MLRWVVGCAVPRGGRDTRTQADPPWLFLYNHRRATAFAGNADEAAAAIAGWTRRTDGVLDVKGLPPLPLLPVNSD